MMDLSTFMTAVKPRERSDQYMILAALFSLEAHDEPVTAKQVSDLLKLHMGKKCPPNVNASLRAYKSYVSPHKGNPLRWSLTSHGLVHLRQLSGLPLSTAADAEAFKSDI